MAPEGVRFMSFKTLLKYPYMFVGQGNRQRVSLGEKGVIIDTDRSFRSRRDFLIQINHMDTRLICKYCADPVPYTAKSFDSNWRVVL